MRFYKSLSLLALLALCSFVLGDDAAPPTTQPSGGVVRGQISFAGGVDWAQPDMTTVVAFLDSDPALDALSTSQPSAVVAQKNKEFLPNFVAICRGTTVEFPNWDHISHNVFSRSAAAPAFDLDRYPYGQSKSRVFEKVGTVQVFCNIHPWMRAIIYVTPNRFFTRADSDGKFQIAGIPPGHYQLTVWQKRCGVQHQAIDIDGMHDATASFQLSEDRDSIISNDSPKHDQRWGLGWGLGTKREQLNLSTVSDVHPAPTTEPCANCK